MNGLFAAYWGLPMFTCWLGLIWTSDPLQVVSAVFLLVVMTFMFLTTATGLAP